jgi:tetratricopeptide (TPR) repeat protein
MRLHFSTEQLRVAAGARRALAARRLSAGLLSAGLLCGSSGRAELPQRAPTETAARAELRADALLEQGIDLRRLGKDQEALTVLEEAVALKPESARARVHLAAAHQALGHWLEADALLRELLQESDDPYVQRHLATLQEAAEFAAQHLGSLLVQGAPAGAAVQVNGRPLGSLPLSTAARLAIGSYQLEVFLEGYSPVRRPISIAPGAVRREAGVLAPLAPPPIAHSGAAPAAPAGGSPRWLSWTLSGLGAGAALTTVVAFGVRNQHAARWNSSACLESGRRRGEVCPDQWAAGKAAERVAYVSGIGTALLAAGAVVSWTLGAPEAPQGVGLASCSLALGGGMCSGAF